MKSSKEIRTRQLDALQQYFAYLGHYMDTQLGAYDKDIRDEVRPLLKAAYSKIDEIFLKEEEQS